MEKMEIFGSNRKAHDIYALQNALQEECRC